MIDVILTNKVNDWHGKFGGCLSRVTKMCQKKKTSQKSKNENSATTEKIFRPRSTGLVAKPKLNLFIIK